jgi:hypothetical protein
VALPYEGHGLLEDVPGVGRTTLARALARPCQALRGGATPITYRNDRCRLDRWAVELRLSQLTCRGEVGHRSVTGRCGAEEHRTRRAGRARRAGGADGCRRRSGGEVVVVDEPAEHRAAPHPPRRRGRDGGRVARAGSLVARLARSTFSQREGRGCVAWRS